MKTSSALSDPGVIVASHYPEGAIMAIAEEHQHRRELLSFSTSWDPGRQLRFADRLGLPMPRKDKLAARSYPTIKPTLVHERSRLSELHHVIVRELSANEYTKRRLMYQVKSRFDHASAAAVERLRPSVVYAVYSSALHTLSAARHTSVPGVLHFVNSHPDVHNQRLQSLAGVAATHHELIPPRIVSQVRAELDVASLVLVPSEMVRKQLIQRAVSPEKIRVIPYGVRASKFVSTRVRPPGSQRQIRCVYIGQIAHRKAVDLLLEVFRQLTGESIVIDLIGSLVSPSCLTSLPTNVRYLGSKSPSGLPGILGDADVLILPSYDDAFGLVVTEAMAAGVPVVVSRNCGAAEVVEEGVTGFTFESGSVDGLVSVLRLILADRDAVTAMGAQAQKSAQLLYDWSVYGERVRAAVIESISGTAA